jgi:protein SCO1/2
MACGNSIRIVLAGLLGGLLISCGAATRSPRPSADGATNQQMFQVKGVVKEIMLPRKKVKIAHEEIPNYMAAMTMDFDVKDVKELEGLQAGDAVAFRMIVTKNDGWIDQLTRLNAISGAGPVTGNAPSSQVDSRESVALRRVREVDPLKEGDLLPEYHFTNELNQAISLSDYKGQALALTFIFTRCPFPTFCPRMSTSFAETCEKMRVMPNSPTNWHLLTISFDPEFDTPAVLKSYAQRYHYDPKHWSFVTGDLIDITAIAEQFGLLFWRPDPNQPAGINHNLRTVVVDAQGRVQKILSQNEWTSDELVGEIVKAASAKP